MTSQTSQRGGMPSFDPYARLPQVPSFRLSNSDIAEGRPQPLAQMSGISDLARARIVATTQR